MRKIVTILADIDAGKPVSKSEEMFAQAHFSELAKKGTVSLSSMEPGTLAKAGDIIVGLASAGLEKVRNTGRLAVEVGAQHRARTKAEKIEALNDERAVVEARKARGAMTEADYNEAIAGIEADLEALEG